ncbi:MAG: nitrous oxide reductase family maturation protein NosD [Elusimicrobia bacterium]|nr:nitrous oxide reductase family maturation protein NosD [Elusimicrobiota bacterium]
MSFQQTSAMAERRRRLAAGLGVVAGVLLAVSAFFPYWQARLFAPQYRQGLTATMHLHKVTGDIQEIDTLNHYVGVRKFDTLAAWERRMALPGLALLILLCLTAFRAGCPLPSWSKVLPVAIFPVIFLADMKYWMHVASTQLDPMAPLKLKPFVIPLLGTGKVGQFRSELGPMPGFFLALAAVILLLEGLWLNRRSQRPDAEPSIPGQNLPKAAVLAGLILFGLLIAGLARAAELPPIQPILDQAPEGSTVMLEPQTYAGPGVISKTLKVQGSGAVIDGGGTGTVLTVSAPDVELEDLILRRSGDSLLGEDSGLKVEASGVAARRLRLEDVLFGVFASNAPSFVLEDSALAGKPLEIGRRGDLIRIWNCDRVRLSRNRLEGGRDMVLWFSTGSVIEGNEASGGRYGLHFMHTNGARVENNLFRDNSVGLYVMYSGALTLKGNRFERHRGPSGAGLGLKESDSIEVRDNEFRENRQAIFVDQSPLVETNENRFERNILAYNDVGIALMPGVRGNVFTGNLFEDNLQQVAVRGGGVLSGNAWDGNYWSDYAGYGRGTRGLVPYRADRVVERLADGRPLLRFFLYTPAAQAMELTARVFPIFKPKPLLTDMTPLLGSQLVRRGAGQHQAPALAAVWAPASLLSASALALAFASRGRKRKAGSASPAPASQIAVSARGLGKSYGNRRLFSNLSFTVMPGECLVLWGSNGAGKSTLMRCILGLEPCEGALLVAGFDVASDAAAARERLGYLSQEFAGYDWTVREAMDFVCEVRGADSGRIGETLASCGLPNEDDKTVPALSGGMKQKLALAQALVADPEILLLDEPCSNLDLKSRRELTGIFSKLKGTRTIVMTSHHLDEVRALADRVLWLEEDRPARLMDPGSFLEEITGRLS